MLADKIQSYENNKTFGQQTPAMYKEAYPYLKEVDSLALANVQLHLQQAIKNCFQSKHCKFPVFKSKKKSRNSYTTSNQKGTIQVMNKAIKLPKVGRIKAKIHRRANEEWKLKSATVVQQKDDTYYVSILYEYPDEKTDNEKSKIYQAIGLDYKSDGLYMDSNGNIGSNHKYYKESHNKLAKEQRRLSRKKVSSNNYEKQKLKIAKIYRHIANQRKDQLHKRSYEIANRYDVVCVEDLNMKSLSNKGFKNGKATLDNGYGMFLRMLEYKLKERNKYLIKIDKWYASSQICCQCGRIHKMKLSERVYKCSCGNECDRDLNAAKNILKEGLRIFSEAR